MQIIKSSGWYNLKRFSKVLTIIFLALVSSGLGIYHNKINKIELIFENLLVDKTDIGLSSLDFTILKFLGFITFFVLIFMYFKIAKKK